MDEQVGEGIHDLLGHTLSVITLKSELASKLATRDAAKAEAEMRDVERISRDALAEVRSAVRGYRAEGLQAELAGAAMMLEAAHIDLEAATLSLTLDSAQERTLAFALREAVTNVVRHSGASRCAVRLFEAGGEVCLEVEDNGVSGNLPEGLGLRGMCERLELLGGRLERRTGEGTRLRIYLPHCEADPCEANPCEADSQEPHRYKSAPSKPSVRPS